MSLDEVTMLRIEEVQKINAEPGEREALEAKYGQVWDSAEVARDFEILGFAAPFVVAIRKSDRKKGSLTFQHNPRYYFAFEEA